MKTKAYTLALLILATPTLTYGDSMIGNLINSLGNSKDISRNNPGVKRISSGPFYVYKLNQRSSKINRSSSIDGQSKYSSEYDLEAIKQALEEQSKNVDVAPERDVINAHNKGDGSINAMKQAERQVLYVDDDSPLKNPSVKAAWDKSREADKRLEQHRDYMERVRKARMRVSNSKKTPSEDSSKASGD